MESLNKLFESKKTVPFTIITFLIITIIRIYFLFSSQISDSLFKVNIPKSLEFIIAIIFLFINLVYIILAVNITYSLIFFLNKKINNNEFKLYGIKNICYIAYLIPLIVNSIFIIFYMLTTGTIIKDVYINTILVNLIISLLLSFMLKYKINIKKIYIIVPIIIFIINSLLIIF